jgi:hypothetical protein
VQQGSKPRQSHASRLRGDRFSRESAFRHVKLPQPRGPFQTLAREL